MVATQRQVAPVLRVRNVRASAAFYRPRLGCDCPDNAIMAGPGDEIWLTDPDGCQGAGDAAAVA